MDERHPCGRRRPYDAHHEVAYGWTARMAARWRVDRVTAVPVQERWRERVLAVGMQAAAQGAYAAATRPSNPQPGVVRCHATRARAGQGPP